MSTYTTSLDPSNNELVFLNDGNIVSDLTGTADYNAIPSQTLFKSTYDILSTDDKYLSDYIVSVETSANSISSEINRLCSEISTAIDGNNSTTDEKFVHISGDGIEWLSVQNSLSAGKLHILTSNSTTGAEYHTGLSVDDSGINVDIVGNDRKIKVGINDGISSIFINDKTLDKHIDDKISNDFTDFSYDTVTHAIMLTLADKMLSVDSTEFIKNRLIYHANVLPLGSKNCLFIWIKQLDDYTDLEKKIEGEDYVKIDVAELTLVYKFSNGISADDMLNVGIDTAKIPLIENLNVNNSIPEEGPIKVISSLSQNSGKIEYSFRNILSSDIVELTNYVTNEIDLSVKSLDVDKLSENNKIISAISEEDGKVAAEFGYVTSANFGFYENDTPINMLQQRQVEKLPEDIKTLSDSFDELNSELTKNLKFIKHITLNKEDQTQPELTGSLITFFTHEELFIDGTTKVANGTIFDVNLSGRSELSDKFIIQDGENQLVLGQGDFLIVHKHVNEPFVDASELTSVTIPPTEKTVFVLKAGVSRYEFEKELFDRKENDEYLSSWLITNFGNTEDADITPTTILNQDVLANKTLSVSGNSTISGDTTLCAKVYVNDDAEFHSKLSVLNTTNLKNDLTVDNVLTASNSTSVLTANNISVVSALTVDFGKAYDETGTSIQDISDAVSSKIWIEDPTPKTFLSAYSDLSVVKISIHDFKNKVNDAIATNMQLCSNVLYVVSSDYIEAYGQVISNLVMDSTKTDPVLSVPSIATTRHYVDTISNSLSVTTKLSIETLSTSLSTEIDNKFNASRLADDTVLGNGLAMSSDISVFLSAMLKLWNTFGGTIIQ